MYPDDVPAAEDRRMCEGKEPEPSEEKKDDRRRGAGGRSPAARDSDSDYSRRLFLRYHKLSGLDGKWGSRPIYNQLLQGQAQLQAAHDVAPVRPSSKSASRTRDQKSRPGGVALFFLTCFEKDEGTASPPGGRQGSTPLAPASRRHTRQRPPCPGSANPPTAGVPSGSATKPTSGSRPH